jgi:putative Mg2+ transporter-C (MgtC) family protein
MFDFGFHLIVFVRIIASVLFGFGIGLERELTNKYAGLRTHILVCMGSCVFTILSIYGFPNFTNQIQPYGDHARVAAQVLTGIGFIGGGTVLRHGSSVSGLTTAATLWVAAAIGMACGAGMIGTALLATILSVGVLVLVRHFETNVLVKSTKTIKRLKISIACNNENADDIHNYIIGNVEHMHEISRKHDEKESELVKIVAIADVGGKKPMQSLYKKFQVVKGIDSISIQESDD